MKVKGLFCIYFTLGCSKLGVARGSHAAWVVLPGVIVIQRPIKRCLEIDTLSSYDHKQN